MVSYQEYYVSFFFLNVFTNGSIAYISDIYIYICICIGVPFSLASVDLTTSLD